MIDRDRALQPVDEDARRLARSLIRAARHGALASLTPGDSWPLASRVLIASNDVGHPLILVSGLSAHTGALLANPCCSLLCGEPGGGDPLAHPRISVVGRAETLENEDRIAARKRFLARHPSAERYCDFGDFRFMRVAVSGAHLNAGFARAYRMDARDLIDDPLPAFTDRMRAAVEHMNGDHVDAVAAIASRDLGEPRAAWRIATGDRRGFEITVGDRLHRIEFEQPITEPAGIRGAFVTLTRKALEVQAPAP